MSDNDATIDDRSALQVAGLSPDGLDAVALAEIRSARDHAVETETGLSYLRRMVQAPLDMVRGELERRAAGETSDLAGPGRRPAPHPERARRARQRPGAPHPRAHRDRPRARRRARPVTQGGMRIAMLPTSSDAELVELAASLDSLEVRVSRKRRLLHRTIDLLNAELARRYGSGELTPEGALADARPDAGD